MSSEKNVSLVVRKREAARLIGISVATLDRLRADGNFIRPIRIGGQAIGFRRTDIERWVESRQYMFSFAGME